MKRTLLFLGMLSGVAHAQNCSEVFISEYVEGTGNDKAIELYNPTGAAINLSGYRIERFSNGQNTSNAGGVLNLTGTIQPYATFVVVNGQMVDMTNPPSPKCSPALQLLANQLDHAYPAPTYMNGNDAIALFKNSVMIDLMGKIGDAAITNSYGWGDQPPYDGSVGRVWTENHTLIRKSSVKTGVTVNPDPFIVNQQWDSLPKDTWTQLGSHTCDCFLSVGENKLNTVSIYPNPASNGIIYVSTNNTIETIEVVDLLGKVVSREAKNDQSMAAAVSTSDLKKGAYLLRINFTDKSSSQQSIIIE
ncbi:lamin tail domain-containing protein [Fluviicola sp.]|uniref:lamin tail domain-containing protein n=1 Tax=Fluviicola sp. TaxID=1917219 RepID=UPI002620B752|nr:lamin tail domain-containing protein [Fluviicola sp.]